MRCTFSFSCVMWLAVLTACSDDGLIQNQNTDSADAGTGGPVTTDMGPGDTGPGVTAGESEDANGTTATTGAPTDDTSGSDVTGGSDTGRGESTSESGETTDGSEGSTTGEPCVPITDDPSAIGLDCQSDAECPDGYTCQPFVGFVLQTQCQILCAQTCECPLGLTCNETIDKGNMPWFQCG